MITNEYISIADECIRFIDECIRITDSNHLRFTFHSRTVELCSNMNFNFYNIIFNI